MRTELKGLNEADQFEQHYQQWSRLRSGAQLDRYLQSEDIDRRFFRGMLADACRRVTGTVPEQPLRVLELGCGPALDLFWLSRAFGADCLGLDISSKALGFAREVQDRAGGKATLVRGDAHHMPFASGSCDLVYSQGVLEHFRDPNPVLQEQVRALRQGGILVICVPQKYNTYTWNKHRLMRQGKWSWGWETEFSPRGLRALGRKAGLQPLRTRGFGYEGALRIARSAYRLVRKKTPGLSGPLFRLVDQAYYGALDPLVEGAWGAIERAVGPNLLINVVVTFRKP